MGERRALAKLSTIMDNTSHPLHQTVGALSSSFSNRLRHPRCRKERFHRDEIRGLKADLLKKDELILEFSSVATAQAKHILALDSSHCGKSNGVSPLQFPELSASVPVYDSTLPWSGSFITGGELTPLANLLAMRDEVWPILGAKPKSRPCSTPRRSEPWVLVKNNKGRGGCSGSASPEPLELSNKFQALAELENHLFSAPTTTPGPPDSHATLCAVTLLSAGSEAATPAAATKQLHSTAASVIVGCPPAGSVVGSDAAAAALVALASLPQWG
ncbi:hypothetical protein L3Q82_010060 [Scortum barcoo]|uniref:Uncharacterized protein n=1 Tax=Scortum barcoo TaxID=214431 RepID=A0ACB8WEP4_9TELE|nr:hypothetical protein L3Q82_010060 [Scortum barcoo]